MIRAHFSIMIILLSVFSFSTQAADSEPVIIRFSHVSSNDSPKGKGALLFQKLVNQRLSGQVSVEVYPDSGLYNDTDGLEALRKNEIQMLAPSLAKFSAYTSELQIFDLPFLFNDLAAVDKFQSRSKGKKLLLSMQKKDILGLAYWHNGMKQMSAIKPLVTPADAAGLTFRIQNSAVLEAQFKALNAKTRELPFAEVFNALATGSVQGAENPWANFDAQNLQQVQPYITETNHGVLDYMLVTNPRFWYEIPHHIRSELESIITEVTYSVNETAAKENAAHREHALASGKTRLITLTPEQRQQWRTAMQPVWQQFSKDINERLIHSAQLMNQ